MYTVSVSIQGLVPGLLQHAYNEDTLQESLKEVKKQVGQPDWSREWLETMFVDQEGRLCQPASHIEGSLKMASNGFKVKGKAGKSWRAGFEAYVYVLPDMIPHLRDGQFVEAPDADLMNHPANGLSVHVARVRVPPGKRGASVARSRLLVAEGWRLDFTAQVIEDTLPVELLHAVLKEAGRACGISDGRPRYGRFEVIHFEVDGKQ